MKLIFLDFDGVLNGRDNLYHGICPRRVIRLNRIITATGANVVVSSTWRKGLRCMELQDLLNSHGFAGRVISTTPVLDRWVKEKGLYLSVERGDEIQAWLAGYRRPVESFVIVDDDDDMGTLSHRLVRTMDGRGLTDEDADRCVAMLTAQNP